MSWSDDKRPRRAPSAGSGQAWTLACAALAAAGLAGWLVYALTIDPERAWRALLVNFVFFTPLAIGMVVWSAIVILSRGQWAEPIKDSALCGVVLAPVSLIAYGALWIGKTHWAGWLKLKSLPQGTWLDSSFVFVRDGLGLLLLWGLALWFARRRRQERPLVLGGVLAFAYSMIVSLMAFDLVMALDPLWYSTLFGGYFFISGLYASVAAWTLTAILQQPTLHRERLQDLGKLIVTFSILTTYLMYSQLLPIWYENLPRETRFVAPRLQNAEWRFVSTWLLAVIYLGPLVVLLTRWSKRTPRFLGAVALAVLIGLWIERWWLVTPALGGRAQLGLVELSITAAFTSAFVFGIQRYRRLASRSVPGAIRA
jgi:hypothetical protein